MKFPFKRCLSSFLSVVLFATSVTPVHAQSQTPAPICYPDSATMQGMNNDCGGVTKSDGNFAYPKLKWEEVGVVDLSVSNTPSQVALGKPSQNLASQAAQVLGVAEKEVIQAVTTYPTNVPVVMGRYSVWDASLTIDIFKLEKAGKSARMLHTNFTPEHGDIWKAAGAYGSTASRQAGALGRNPFDAFKDGSGRFKGISAAAAQVAIGHAQRLVQAPVSVLAVVNSNIRPATSKRSCGLKKCITTKYWLDMDTQWYLGMPPEQAHRALASMPAGFCVTAPSTPGASCSAGELATAGVAFVPQEGGTFMNEQVSEYVGEQTKKTWSLLGVLAITFVLGLAGSVLGTALVNSAVTAGSAGIAGASTGVTVGTVSSAGALTMSLQYVGLLGSFTSYAAMAAVETALTGGLLVGLGGADLSSPMRLGTPGFVSSQIPAVAAAVNPADQTNQFVQKGAQMTRARTVERMDAAIAPVRRTLMGDCGMNGTSAACGGNSQGVVQRADQLTSTNTLQLYRDADGQLMGR